MLGDTSNVPPENKGKDKIFMTEMPPLITARPKTPWAKIFQITVFSIFGVVIVFYVLGLSLTLKSEKDKNVFLHVHDTVQFHVYEEKNNNDYKAEILPQKGFFDFFFPQNLKPPGNVEIQIIEIEEGNGDDEIPTEMANLVSSENDKKLGDSEKMVSVSEKNSPEVSTESSSVSSASSGSDSSSSGSSSKDSSSSSDISSPETSLKTSHRTFPRIFHFEDMDKQFQNLDRNLFFPSDFPFEDFKTVDEIFKTDPFFNK